MLSIKHCCRFLKPFVRNHNYFYFYRDIYTRRFLEAYPNKFRSIQYSVLKGRFFSSENDAGYKYPGSKKKIHAFEECHTPNIMSSMPAPIKPWEAEFNRLKKRNIRVFILGLIVFLATLGVVLSLNYSEKKRKTAIPKKRQKRLCPRNPSLPSDIPKKVPYVLIGGGTASFSAFRSIKSADPEAQILIITNECFNPYMRPPLSKEMWFNEDVDKVKKLIFRQWNGTERSLFYEPDDFYISCADLLENDNGGISVVSGYTATEIDAYCKKITLDNGYEISYEKCLIATGASPKIPPVFQASMTNPEVEDRVKVLRNIFDFQDMRNIFQGAASVAVIGGSFLGSELSCALGRIGKAESKQVYQIFRETGNMGKVLPEYLCRWTTDKVIKEGVEVVPNVEVLTCSFNEKDKCLHLGLSSGKTLKVDSVILAVGSEANTQLAEKAGLEVDPELGGFLVNPELQARTDLYIAGDCSCFYDPKFGRRRIEHHDHAVVTGRLAGENMTGSAKPYIHQSMFWSDLGPEVGFEAIGVVDSALPTVGVFAKANPYDNPKGFLKDVDDNIRSHVVDSVPAACDKHIDEAGKKEIELKSGTLRKDIPKGEEPEEFGKGVIFYLRNDIVVGIVLWNVFNRIKIARQVLREDKKYEDLNEVAKLFNIHEE